MVPADHPLRASEGQRPQGRVDESAGQFTDAERHIAQHLAAHGHVVVALPIRTVPGLVNPDALVDGQVTEFKTLDVDDHATVRNALSRGMRQARHVVIHGRAAGLSEANARRGLARILGGRYAERLDSVRIIGSGYAYIVFSREG